MHTPQLLLELKADPGPGPEFTIGRIERTIHFGPPPTHLGLCCLPLFFAHHQPLP